MEKKAPHSATVAQRKAPHSATVVQGKAPHPATVAQRKAPHSATVVQRKAPHPATLGRASAGTASTWVTRPAGAVQRMAWPRPVAPFQRGFRGGRVAQPYTTIDDDGATWRLSTKGDLAVRLAAGNPYRAQLAYVGKSVAIANGFEMAEEGTVTALKSASLCQIRPSNSLLEALAQVDDCRKVAILTAEKTHGVFIWDSSARTHMLRTKSELSIFAAKSLCDMDTSTDVLVDPTEQTPIDPEVADVLGIIPGGKVIKGKENDTWSYHFATVVAVSGDHYLTFENFRNNDPSNWYFALYGPGKQSYHVEWAYTVEFGSQPVTHRFKVVKA